MDALSEVLKVLRFNSAIFFNAQSNTRLPESGAFWREAAALLWANRTAA